MRRYILLLIVAGLCFTCGAQKKVQGMWEGVLHVGVDLRVIFHINGSEGKYSTTMDVPGQGVKDIPASTRVDKDSIYIEIEKVHGTFNGRIENDSTINGEWFQGRSFQLLLKKVTSVTAAIRPQTPKPPYPYTVKEIVNTNPASSIQYGATITIPVGKGPFPAVLLLTGSGQQNRDEEILEHKPFAVIADYLTRRGYVVMRVDDRGMGQTNGDLAKATSRDFADDAEVNFNYLKNLPEVDKNKMGLLGHSEGGMIAQMIAAERNDVNFVIFFAGPGEKVSRLMEDQNIAIFQNAGISQSFIDAYIKLYNSLMEAITKAPTSVEATKDASKLTGDWVKSTDQNIVLRMTGITDESSKEKFVNSMVSSAYIPWYRYFYSYDPAPYLEKMQSHVLALNGDKDVQVISKTNLPAMQASLQKGSVKDVTIKELPGLNHLFQHCHTCSVQEYGQLQETMAPEVLSLVAAWLDDHVKNPAKAH